MRSKLLFLALGVIAVFILYQPKALAQYDIMEASITVENRTYTPLTSWIYDNDYPYYYTYVNVTGFPFIFDNISWNYICAYGSMSIGFSNSSLGYRYPYYYNSYDYFSYSTIPSVYGFWTMADCFYSSNPRLRIGVLGNYPNRSLVFEWQDMKYYYSYYNQQSSFNLQIILYEGSNNIEIHYGKLDKGATEIGINNYTYYYYHRTLIGFSGYQVSTTANWLNVDPNGNGNTGYNRWEFWKAYNPGSRGLYYRSTIQWNEDLAAIQYGDVIKYGFGAEIKEQYPEQDVNLIREYVYGDGTTDPYGNGDNQRPAIHLAKLSTPSVSVHRTIHGPLSFPPSPYYKVIYDATQNVPNDVLTNFTTKTPGSTDNVAFGTGGALDLTNTDQIKGGLFQVDDKFNDKGKDYESKYNFNIALYNDLELTKVLEPKPYTDKKYPLTSRVPVKILVTNRGMNEASKFYAIAWIYNEDGDQIWTDSVYWEAGPGQALKLGDNIVVDFKEFRPTAGIGKYEFKVKISYIGDEEATNNTIPWAGQPKYWFQVAPEIEAEALAILSPKNVNEQGNAVSIYVGRPIRPRARFQNNGITDISDAPATIDIYLKGQDTPIWSNEQLVEVIPQGIINNKADWLFDFFTPPVAGTYYACVTINALDDDFIDNNTVCDTFEVTHALAGTYTIGPNKGDSAYDARNFTTLQSAVDALYLQGLTGSVVFQFTTSHYIVGNQMMDGTEPALDMRSHIIGLDDKHTITFQASQLLSATKGSVTLDMYSGVGIGILFGQSPQPLNLNAVVNNVPSGMRKTYANSPGYINFDGGIQRSLKFVMHSPVRLNTPFYLSQGASNISIKNCIITSSSPADSWLNYSLPLIKFVSPQFEFELDNKSLGTESYTAGIVLRSIAPKDKLSWDPAQPAEAAINTFNLDTLENANNNIVNNDISGFAYGVVSLGIGPLSRDGVMKGYYNNNNTISKNFIHDVSRAGIFAGHEMNTSISRNKIYGVASTVTGHNPTTSVAGIMLGGEAKLNFLGYNNINMSVNGNEISNVGKAVADASNNYIYGIKAEQCRNDYQGESFPNTAENTVIKNNAIWGILSGVADANRCGIRLFTQRDPNAGYWENVMITPMKPDYYTMGDKIANNTVIIDNDGYNTSGAVAAIAVQNSYATIIENNAMAMLDNNLAGATNTYAAIVDQGILPKDDGGILSDRNVFWLKPKTGATDSAAAYRFVEMNADGELIHAGERNEYLTMNQWQMYSGEDMLSTMRDFTVNLTTPDINEPLSELRIKNTPTWPVGSVLNNRGAILDFVEFDIDGNVRGTSGQRYDIGASEFPGILLNSDVEISACYKPGAYRATTTVFSDAEYIMTEAPVDVSASLRNNGALGITGLKAKVKIYRESPAGGYLDKPDIEKEVALDILSGENEEVSFNLADGDADDWYPMTYGDWNYWYRFNNDPADQAYTIPANYSTMVNNISPHYRIDISVQSDEDVTNNTFSKVVRFYLKRSNLDLLVTGENTFVDLQPTATSDQAAGRRNYDSLASNLKRIGWWNRWYYDGIDTMLLQNYDVFERTAWEPRAVNYTMYTSMLWSDGDDKPLTREQRADITNFIESGTPDLKKNLVVSSQDMARENWSIAQTWVENILRVKLDIAGGYPTGPAGGGTWYAGDANPAINITNPEKFFTGENVGRGLQFFLLNTNLTPSDPAPVPALVDVYQMGDGLSRSSHLYNPDALIAMPDPAIKSFGVATTTLNNNTVYLGAEWRHYGQGETMLRATLDYLAKNGSAVIPVELISFDADVVGTRVNLMWETASELNSDKFVVEKAVMNDGIAGSFVSIAEEKAAGKSIKRLSYSVSDKDVVFGNTYVYRLKMVDLDGTYDYSNNVVVSIGNTGSPSFWLSEATPNPASYKTKVKVSMPEPGNIEILLYDVTGKMIGKAFSGMVNKGVNDVDLDLSGLNNGVYTYTLSLNGKLYARQVNVVN